MNVTVKYYLNVRVGKPSVNAPSYQYLAPGSVLEVDGVLYEGDMFEGSNKWLKDAVGNYYWAGGVTEINPVHIVEGKQLLFGENYNSLFVGIDAYRSTKGENVKIAIIDSGIDLKHDSFKQLISQNRIKSFDLITKNGVASDETGHGTFVAGIIAASSTTNGISGLAPDSTIYNIKAADDNNPIDLTIVKALQLAMEEGVDIINISYNITYATYTLLQDLLRTAAQRNIIIVAAAGDNGDLVASPYVSTLFYPAEDSNVVAVGAITSDVYLSQKSQLLKSLDYIMPLAPLKSCGLKNDFLQSSGCSFSTAMVTGVIANIISHYKATGFTKDQILSALSTVCKSEPVTGTFFQNKYILIKN